jgi:steroid 5-alpha reductase family enzyme
MKNTLTLIAAVLWIVWMAGLLNFKRRPELRVGTAREFVYPIAALVIGLVWLMVDPSSQLGQFLQLYVQAGLISWLMLTGVWLLSLWKRDCGIMDVAYPLAASVPVMSLLLWRGNWSPHEIMLAMLVTLWSLRMSLHIGLRNRGHAEDGRYAAWRRRFDKHWWWWSFFQVFTMQGVTVWLWSLGLIMAVHIGAQPLGWQHGLALLLFGVGYYFQVVGDLQLERFKKQRTDRSQVLDQGLWRLSRHPNYFGESVVWWSFGALALVHPWGWLALVCPAYVTWFMSAGSATPMQERYMAKTKPSYAAYMARVPTFFPWGKPK